MKKKLIISGALVASIIAAGGVGYAAISSDCGYDAKGNFHSGGKVHAFGTMNDAKACAEKGILPEVVAKRLGVWGDAATKKEAEAIKKLDATVKAEKEAAEKAAAEAAKAKESK
jgi:hypothetical protein